MGFRRPPIVTHSTDILRDEWKFNGFVVSDYNSVHELIPHGIAADDSQASLKAMTAGVDMDMADDDYERLIPASGEIRQTV